MGNRKGIQMHDSIGNKVYPCPYYPVGSIYLSITNTNPNRYFGGQWSKIAQGRTLVGVDTNDTDFNTVQKTGGSKSLQAHHHDIRFSSPVGNGVTISNTGTGEACLNVSNWNWDHNGFNYKGSTSNLYTNQEGTVDSGNLQPYFTCYIWCRTA